MYLEIPLTRVIGIISINGYHYVENKIIGCEEKLDLHKYQINTNLIRLK